MISKTKQKNIRYRHWSLDGAYTRLEANLVMTDSSRMCHLAIYFCRSVAVTYAILLCSSSISGNTGFLSCSLAWNIPTVLRSPWGSNLFRRSILTHVEVLDFVIIMNTFFSWLYTHPSGVHNLCKGQFNIKWSRKHTCKLTHIEDNSHKIVLEVFVSGAWKRRCIYCLPVDP